jgi:hypothetical protein
LSTVHGWLVDARRAERAPVTLAEITVPELGVPRAAPVSGWAAEVVLPSGLIVRLRDPLPPAALRGLLRGGRC